MRFTIRDLLWLTVVVALCVGWFVDRERLLSRVEQAEKTVEFLTWVAQVARNLGRQEAFPTRPPATNLPLEPLRRIGPQS